MNVSECGCGDEKIYLCTQGVESEGKQGGLKLGKGGGVRSVEKQGSQAGSKAPQDST